MAIILELLSRKNMPLKHYKFDQDYVCVGRDFNNDLRLDDPYVCPSHMLVAIDPESGQLMVNDCQSTNGIKINNKFVNHAILNSNDVIKIGRTRLRIIDTKIPQPVAIPLSELEENLSWLNQAMLAMGLFFLCLSFLLFSSYLDSVQGFSVVKALPGDFTKLAIFSLWPFSFAILAKVVKKESHIVSQFSLTWLVLLLANGLIYLQSIAIFNIHPGLWFAWFELVVFAILVGGFIWLSLFIAFHQTNRRRNIIAFSMTFIILAPIYVLGFLNDDKFNPRPSYNPILLPPAYNITPASSTDAFLSKADALFKDVDKLKAEKP